MRKTPWLFAAGLALAAVLAGIFLAERAPFRDLQAGDIAAATVQVLPPGTTVELDRAEIEELAGLLREVRITRRDDSHTMYNGQACLFTLTLAGGDTMELNARNPFFLIDGRGYRTDYGPCEALSTFANRICGTWP